MTEDSSETGRGAPQRIGDFEIVRKLGEGAMGKVYKAWDDDLKRFVAIKVLSGKLERDSKATGYLHREARNAALMEHENVVRTYLFKASDREPYIVMEFVNGIDCEHLLEHHAPLEMPVVLALLLDVARGMEHAHAPGRQIAHRDIKPSNIMLSRDGVGKVMDFGLGRNVEGDVRYTVHGDMVGTIAYMSPEQADDRDAGLPSDVFSLGVVAYKLLTGRRPFDDGRVGWEELLRRVRNDEPEPLENLRPEASIFLAQLTLAMLAKAPEARPTSAQVVAELEEEVRRRDILNTREVLRKFAQSIVPTDPDEPAYRARRLAVPKVHGPDRDDQGGDQGVPGWIKFAAVPLMIAAAAWGLWQLVKPHPPQIASFTPATGRVGERIAIRGSDFKDVQTVSFRGRPAASFSLDSLTRISAIVPESASTGPITVTTNAGSVSSGTDFVIQAPSGSSPPEATAGLLVRVVPTGARVLVDNTLVPGSDGRVSGLDPAPHTIHAEKSGFVAVDTLVTPAAGREMVVALQLRKLPGPPGPPGPSGPSGPSGPTGSTGAPTADELLTRADGLAEPHAQIQAYDDFARSFPDHPRLAYALYRVGYIYSEIGDDERAAIALKTVVTRFPGTEQAESAAEILRQIATRKP